MGPIPWTACSRSIPGTARTTWPTSHRCASERDGKSAPGHGERRSRSRALSPMLEILKVISFLLRTSRDIKLARLATYGAIAAGLLSGIGHTTLLALVNSGLAAPAGRRLVLAFAATCVVVPASRFTSQVLFNLIGARSVFLV